jgi:hypothetical protein
MRETANGERMRLDLELKPILFMNIGALIHLQMGCNAIDHYKYYQRASPATHKNGSLYIKGNFTTRQPTHFSPRTAISS